MSIEHCPYCNALTGVSQTSSTHVRCKDCGQEFPCCVAPTAPPRYEVTPLPPRDDPVPPATSSRPRPAEPPPYELAPLSQRADLPNAETPSQPQSPVDFYYLAGLEVFGPLTGIELREAAFAEKVVADTLVSNKANGPWVAENRVKGLFDRCGMPLPHPPDALRQIDKPKVVSEAVKPPQKEFVTADLIQDTRPQMQPSNAPVTESPESLLSGDDINVGELLAFLNGLPDRDVTRIFEDGSRDTVPLGTLRSDLTRKPRNLSVFTPDLWHVVTTAKKQAQWVCLEYGCSLAHLERIILRDEADIADDRQASDLVHIFRDIEARIELGVEREAYAQVMTTNYLHIKDSIESYSDSFPNFAGLVSGILGNYRNALEIWREGPGSVPYNFSGGGFGIQGAVTGMAIGVGLNAIVAGLNKSKHRSMVDRLLAEWNLASRKIRIIENVTRDKNR